MHIQTPNDDTEWGEPSEEFNDKKRKELETRYGGKFPAAEKGLLSAEAEARRMIRHLEEFEEKIENARRVPLRQLLGYPRFRPLSEVTPDELEDELNNVLDYLALQQIHIDTLCDVSDADLYRFITEELLDEEVEDIRTPALNTHFIYEEFHPNDEYDVKMWAEDFLGMILRRDVEYLHSHLSPDELYTAKGLLSTRQEMMGQIHAFLARNPVITNVKLKPVKWQVVGDYATVEMATGWESFKAQYSESIQITGHSRIRLKRSPDIGWDIIQAQIAGWHDL